MPKYVSDTLHSHPEWPLCRQFLLPHWWEKSNFCTNRFVSSKRTFWYVIWSHSPKFGFRCSLQPSVSSSSRFWMVLVFSSNSLSAQDLNFHASFISLGQRMRKLDWIMYLKYSIFIQNRLVIIIFSSTIGPTIFKPVSFDPSFQDEDFDVSYVSLASKVRLGPKIL